jgi:hypothetical protein
MSENELELWNVVGTWLSGIATTAAVIVSLYLARRTERVHLRVSAGVRTLVTMGSNEHPEFLMISVVNEGSRPVIVAALGWSMGWMSWGPFKRMHFYQPPSLLPQESPLPTTLAHGHVGRYLFPLHGADDWVKSFAAQVAKLPLWKRKMYLKALRLHISPTIGRDQTFPVESRLIERLLEVAEAQ